VTRDLSEHFVIIAFTALATLSILVVCGFFR
jgi:hypothetical protein